MDFASQILFEDNHLMIINKRSGQLAQGDKSGDLPVGDLAKAFIKERDHKPGNVYLGVPHRLDRPVTGVLVLAKTSKAMTRLSEMFREKRLDKTYFAIVDNAPPKPSGKLIGYMQKNERMNKSFVVDHEKAGHKRAELDYRLLSSSDRYHLLEVKLHTGRHHQIRAQLANMGCRIKGDLKYGFPRSNTNGSIDLHARQITFIHPVKKNEETIVAPLPQEKLWQHFAKTMRSDV